ncbi:MAG TPA: phage/plasmid primase, P4 family, partial [Gemmatimonadaceae bacterium]
PSHHERDDYFNSMAFEMRKLRLGKEAALVELRERWEKTEQPPGDEYPWENVVEKVERIWEDVAPDPEDEAESWLGKPERLTDDGNALLFVAQHLDDVRFATDVRRWHAWDGARWVAGAETQVLDHARETARSLGALALDVKDDDARKSAFGHAKASLSSAKIQAIPVLAKSDARISVKVSDFDSDPWLLNTPNGTLDLRTGVVREHRREDLIAKVTRVPYDPNADMSWWHQWLDWASAWRPDWVEHLQRAAGYALTGSTGEQVFWMFLGPGANGKSTFLSAMEMTLGDYALHAEPELLTPREGASTTGVADLQGRRFVVAVETKEGKRLDERQVKQLTGSDTITARKLYQDFMEFRPTHKIFYAMNHLPKVTDVTPAFWRRVLLVPWESVISKEQQRPDVAEWIVANHGPAVLRWAVEGCLKYQRDGLAVPDYVRARTQRYQSEEDTLGAFIDAHLVTDHDGWASTGDVWAAFQRWCEQERVREPLGRNKLLDEVERRLGVQRGRISWEGAKVRVFHGVRLDVEGER